MRRVYGHFARLGFKYRSFDPDDIADIVIFFVRRVYVFADVLTGDINLEHAVFIGDVRKGSLSHDAARHQSAGNGNFLPFPVFEIFFYLRGVRGQIVFGFKIRILSLGGNFCEFFSADTRLFGEFFRGVQILFHNNFPFN